MFLMNIILYSIEKRRLMNKNNEENVKIKFQIINMILKVK